MIWNRKKTGITAAAVIAAAAFTGGGVAIAHAQDSGQGTPSATSTASPTTGTSGKAGKAGKAGRDGAGLQAALTKLADVQHAQWVAKEASNGSYVTHDAIRGAVTAVTSSSITVKAGDGVSQTYALTGTTKIAVGGAKAAKGTKGTKPSSGAASDIATGATVIVTGTGTSSLTADRVVVPAS